MASARVKPRRGKLYVYIIQAAVLIWIVRVQRKLFGLGPSIPDSVSLSSNSQSAHLGIARACRRFPLSSFRRLSSSTRSTNLFLLILIAGDVERNPGPTVSSLSPTDNTPAPGPAHNTTALAASSTPAHSPADNTLATVGSTPALMDNSSSSG